MPCFCTCSEVEHKTSYISAKSGMAISARRTDPLFASLNYVVCSLLSETRGRSVAFLLGKLSLFSSYCSFRTQSITNSQHETNKVNNVLPQTFIL